VPPHESEQFNIYELSATVKFGFFLSVSATRSFFGLLLVGLC